MQHNNLRHRGGPRRPADDEQVINYDQTGHPGTVIKPIMCCTDVNYLFMYFTEAFDKLGIVFFG